MSNFITTGGWGGPLVVTQGWGAGITIPSGKSIIKMATGSLLIDVEASGGEFFLQYEDGINTIFQQLQFTAAQKSGTDFAIIKVSREGGNLVITQDEIAIATIAISIVTYGGLTDVMELNSETLFDLRIVKNKVSKGASDYYVRDILENSGDSNLPSAG